MRNMKSAFVARLLAAVVALPAAAAELGTQKSTDRGVTVDVTPQILSTGASTWDFKIVLDTHSGNLSDDLVKSSVLLDGTGSRHAPVAWDGAPPEGHHREGVLKFNPVSPRPESIELQIQRPGEPGTRSFRWQLK